MNGFIMIALALLLGVDNLIAGAAIGWLRTIAAALLLLVGLVEVVCWFRGHGWLEWKKTPPPAPRAR